MLRRALPFVLASVLVAPMARAQPRVEEPTVYDNFRKAERETEEMLANGSCVSACQALKSLRQAAEEICKITDGPRCERARSSAEEMTKKVRAQCPDCVIAGTPEPDRKAPATEAPKPPLPADAAGTKATGDTANAPRAEKSRGGCASCDVTGSESSFDPSWIALVLWAISRRKKKSPSEA